MANSWQARHQSRSQKQLRNTFRHQVPYSLLYSVLQWKTNKAKPAIGQLEAWEYVRLRLWHCLEGRIWTQCLVSVPVRTFFFPIVKLLLVVDSQSQSQLTIPWVSQVGLAALCLTCKDREKLTSVPFPWESCTLPGEAVRTSLLCLSASCVYLQGALHGYSYPANELVRTPHRVWYRLQYSC